MGWWDILDIIVVSFIIYETLKLIRGTRAVQMAIGAGVFVALFYGSRWSRLGTVNWLVRNLAGYVVIAVIVLFQSDIRRALAHLGRAPFFRYLAKPESKEESIEELVVAAGMLSSQRIGAIIVIERQIGLRSYVEGGIPLDAVLTYDLLLSIFQKTSPLHDGAVIIRGDTIVGAGAILPLSQVALLDRALGTRHRAALGLSEESDAIVVLVSEESSTISIAMQGRLYRNLTPAQVREMLSGKPPRQIVEQSQRVEVRA